MTSPTLRPARLVDYAPWILRDYLTNQGPATTIVVMLVMAMMLAPAFAAAGPVPFGGMPERMAFPLLRELVVPLAFLGAFFATNGIVANDRKFGYFRFLFSKPVHPAVYYALTFVVYGVGVLLVTLVVAGAWAVAVRPMFVPRLFVVVVIMYVAYGGIGLLLSAAWRFDWLSLITVVFVANVAWSVWGEATGWRHTLLYLLPPVHRAGDVYALVGPAAAGTIRWDSIGWVAGYGLACFFLGLVVIRRRPLGTS